MILLYYIANHSTNIIQISFLFMTDHDHLWFDPNWKHISSNSSTCNNRQMNGSAIGNGMDTNEDDPMAAMLENNAKNKNATNIFLNQLHNIKTNDDGDNGAPEYAEVDGMVNSKQSILISDINQGPYATTTLVNTPRTTSNHGVRYLFAISNIFSFISSTSCDNPCLKN